MLYFEEGDSFVLNTQFLNEVSFPWSRDSRRVGDSVYPAEQGFPWFFDAGICVLVNPFSLYRSPANRY